MKKFVVGALLAAPIMMWVLGSAMSVSAFELKDPILEKNGMKYAETGVAESKDDPRWKEAPLLLEFATARAELYSDIAVRILDAQQKEVFSHQVNSPWLVIWLDPGTYTVYAKDRNNVEKTATVKVTAAHQKKTFKW